MFGFPEEVLADAGVEKGGVVRKPTETAKSAARDILQKFKIDKTTILKILSE